MRQILCKKYNEQLEALDKAPYPGEKGQWVYDNLSVKAWKGWLELQTRLINEKGLSLLSPDAQAFLSEAFEKYINNEEIEADGYVPPSK